jgi:hypothetical protein
VTDRHSAYIVTLAEDIREDDAEAVLIALRMVSGVPSVKPLAASWEVHVAGERRDSQWRDALYGIARDGPDPA